MLLSLLIACSPLPGPQADLPAAADSKGELESLLISSSLRTNGGDFMVWTFTVVNRGAGLDDAPYFWIEGELPTLTADEVATLDPVFVQEVDDEYYNAGNSDTSTLVAVASDGGVVAFNSGLAAWASEQFCVRVVSTDSLVAPNVIAYDEDPTEEEDEDTGKDTGSDDTGSDDTGKDTGSEDTGKRDTGDADTGKGD